MSRGLLGRVWTSGILKIADEGRGIKFHKQHGLIMKYRTNSAFQGGKQRDQNGWVAPCLGGTDSCRISLNKYGENICDKNAPLQKHEHVPEL